MRRLPVSAALAALSVTVVAAPAAVAAGARAGGLGVATAHVALQLRSDAAVLPTAGLRRRAVAEAISLGLRVTRVTTTTVSVTGPASVFPGAGAHTLDGEVAVPPALTDTVLAATDTDNHDRVAAPHYLSGADLGAAYAGGVPGGYSGLRPTLGAATPIIASLQLTGLDTASLTAFAQQQVFTADSTYDPVTMPTGNPQFSAVGVDRSPAFGGSDSDDSASEFALDEEAMLAVAPEARLRAYVATNSANGLLSAFNQVLADVTAGAPIVAFSTSWGSCEEAYSTHFLTTLNDVLTRLTRAGVTVFAASGDDGLRDCAMFGHSEAAVDFPASSPAVVAVGGTTHPNGAGTPLPDTAWSSASRLRGSGGGVSKVFPRPAWQAAAGHGDARQVPDLALDADARTGFGAILPDSTQPDGVSPLQSVGGTSLAAPAAAAMLTNLEVAHGFGGTPHGVGDIHPALYRAALSVAGAFTDVVSVASNSPQTIQPVGPGYDEATGLGTPNWSALATALYASAPATPRAPTMHVPGTVPSTVRVTFTPAPGQTAIGYYVWLAGHDYGCTGNPYHPAALVQQLPLGRQRLVVHAIGRDLVCSAGHTLGVRVGLDDRAGKRSAGWTSLGNRAAFNATFVQSSRPGATVSWRVDGRSYDLLLDRVKGAARVAVLIDGKVIRTVRLPGGRVRWAQLTNVATARNGQHTVTVRVLSGTVRVDGLLLH